MTNEEIVKLYQSSNNKEERRELLELMVKNNTGIVNKIVYHYSLEKLKRNLIDYDDLYQEGRIGLICAMSRYNINNPTGAKFITYAVYWINQRIHSFLHRKNNSNEVSINAPIGTDKDGEEFTLEETLKDPVDRIKQVEEKIYYEELRKELDEVMRNHLTLKQQECLKLYCGWYGAEPMTFRAIGEVFDITGSAVRDKVVSARLNIRKSPWGRKRLIEIAKEEELRARNKKYDTYSSLESYEDIKKWLDRLLQQEAI